MGEQDDVATLGANIAVAVVGHGDLAAAVADFHRLPPDLPSRGLLAVGLVEALVRVDAMTHPTRFRGLEDLLPIAEGVGLSTPAWRRTAGKAEVLSLMLAVGERRRFDFDVVCARLDTLARESVADPGLTQFVDMAQQAVRLARAIHEGNPGIIAQFPAAVRQFMDTTQHLDDPRLRPMADMVAAIGEALAANERGEELAPRLDAMRAAAAGLPPGEANAVFGDFEAMLAPLVAATGGAGAPLAAERLDEPTAQADQVDLPVAEQALRHTGAAISALRVGEETDPVRIEEAVGHLRQALQMAGPGDPMRVFHLFGLALALFRRAALNGYPTLDLRESVALLEEARTLAGGPQHAQWQILNELLSNVRRMLGDAPDYHRSAVEGMQGHVWRVLLQTDLAGATSAVRRAATDAIGIARTCLVAGDPAGAIAALDAGRGLALFAATEIGGVADRLELAGDPELAARWRTAAAAHDAEQLSSDLRRDVLTALTERSAAGDLLNPPAFEEIQRALTAVDADALVYLVPGAASATGWAVVAPAVGPPSYMALTELTVEKVPEVERFLTALNGRDAGEVAAPADDAELAGSLDDVSGWAWGAAMGPLIERYLARLPEPATGRPRRVVLVPMGDLARVPWPAARRSDGRYAIELVAISQAASARMLCRSAALAPVAPSPLGLVVGDPDTTDPETGEPLAADLRAARLEAFAIRQVLYRGARYVGRRPDGSASTSGDGTREQVRKWLEDTGPAAGAMLHLACHGDLEAGTDYARSYLLLAAGERLFAEELIAMMAKEPERVIGLVVLAACRTGVVISGYDEAYSLGTAFLAGGARSVLATQWRIPDVATSAQMFMFHRFLRTEGMPVWAALRAAQLWMLDRGRKLPDDMPSPLRRQVAAADLDAVVAWAAFVHGGQ